MHTRVSWGPSKHGLRAPSRYLAVPELCTTPSQGSSVCKRCQLFAGRWEELNSPGAQANGEHHPLQQTVHMNDFIHTVCSLPTPLTSGLRNSPGRCLAACLKRFLAWYLAFLLTLPKICTSLLFSLAVRWLGTVLCARVEATLRQGVLDWREGSQAFKSLSCAVLP